MIDLSVFAGSRFDPPMRGGLSHFTEHMLVSGTKSLPSKTEIGRYIEQLGGLFGAQTGYETLTVYIGLAEGSDLRKGLVTLSEMFYESLFEKNAIETERGAILSELRSKKSRPQDIALANLHSSMYRNDPLGHLIIGTEKEIADISHGDLVEYGKNHIEQSRTSLVVAGGVEAKNVIELYEELFHFPKEVRKITPPKREEIGQLTTEHYAGIEQIAVAIGWHVPPILSRDSAALTMLAEILGGGRSSVLMQRLRYEKGLVYSISAENHEGSDCGEFVIRTGTQKQNITELIEIIKSEIVKIASGLMPDTELQFAKEKLLKSRIMKMETSGRWVFEHSFGILCDPEYSTAHEDEKLKNVTMDDMVNVAKNYLSDQGMFVSLTGDMDGLNFKLS